MPFSTIEHTADVGVRATAATFDEALADAVMGMFHILAPEATPDAVEERVIEVDAAALPDLVIDVLDDINFLHQLEGFLAAKAKVLTRSEGGRWIADIVLTGETYESTRHGHLMEIKATTYHGLAVRTSPPHIEVIFDI